MQFLFFCRVSNEGNLVSRKVKQYKDRMMFMLNLNLITMIKLNCGLANRGNGMGQKVPIQGKYIIN